MIKPDIPLSDDEVRQIGRIITALDASTFDYLQLELGALKLTIGKGGLLPPALPAAPTAVAAPSVAPIAAATPAASDHALPEDGTVAIVAPMIGHFYSQPEPGAAAYVGVGSEVTAESTVGLVESVKMFNAVHAGVNGVITRICVEDAALVEYGQTLFHVRPHPSA